MFVNNLMLMQYELINEKINVKFKNDYYVSLGKSYSPSNIKNTIWFEKFIL